MTSHRQLDVIHVHPNNPRRNAVADDDMVASIRSVGIAQALTVMPYAADCPLHDECFTLAGGHRRLDGARKAGLAEVPVMVRDDLVMEAQQLEFMLVENLHRVDLTPVEQADTYVQLELLGMDDAAIASAVGQSAKTIKARKRLVTLSATASAKLHAGQITIGDAEALLEFSDDPEILAGLEENLGRKDFAYFVQAAKETRTRVARNTKIIEDFTEFGAAEAGDEDDFWALLRFSDESLRDPAGHTHSECLGYRHHGLSSYSEPFLGCLDPSSHGEAAATPAPGRGAVTASEQEAREAEWQAQREAAAAERDARTAAAKVRVDHLAGVIEGALQSKDKKRTAVLTDATRALLPATLYNRMVDDLVDVKVLAHALGHKIPESGGYHEESKAWEETAAAIAVSVSPAELIGALAGFLATLAESALSSIAEHGVTDDSGAERAMSGIAWDWLAATGYELSTTDEEVRAAALAVEEDDDA